MVSYDSIRPVQNRLEAGEMPTLNDLHLAMGEFLTESSQVENMMLALVMVCRDDRPRDDVFVGFMEKTFGDKIKIFKARCRTRNFTDAHRKILDDVEVELAGLLLKRNLIVHGTTYQLGKDGIPPQPYRIGMTKAGAFLNEAIADLDAPHVFTVHRIKETTAKFVAMRARLGIVTNEVMTGLARKR
jgi:hypothetical protein